VTIYPISKEKLFFFASNKGDFMWNFPLLPKKFPKRVIIAEKKFCGEILRLLLPSLSHKGMVRLYAVMEDPFDKECANI